VAAQEPHATGPAAALTCTGLHQRRTLELFPRRATCVYL